MADLRRLVTDLERTIRNLEQRDVITSHQPAFTSAVGSENSETSSSLRVTTRTAAGSACHQPACTTPIGSAENLNSTTSSSLRSLFHWNPTSNTGKRKHKASQNSGSRTKKKKIQTWTHTFVCLSNTSQEYLPDGDERASLQIAGLGEKKITLYSSSAAHEINEELLYSFPKLSHAGGFELLRVPEGGGKHLDVVAAPEYGYTVSYLRAVIHHAKIYILPLQRDLSLEPEKDEVLLSEPPKETCLNCNRKVSTTSLRQHMVSCKSILTNQPKCSASVSSYSIQDDIPIVIDNDIVIENDIDYPTDQLITVNSEHPTTTRSNSPDNQNYRLDSNLQMASHDDSEPKNIVDVIEHLQHDQTIDDTFEMVVRRSHILADALRKMQKLLFDPRKRLDVVFVGEEGCDGGGLTREFFRLIAASISVKYMDTGCFRHNAIAYQESIYLHLGILAGMSIVHEGASFKIMSDTVYRFMCGNNPADLVANIDEVPDAGIRSILKQFEVTNEVHKLRQLAFDSMDLLIECGVTKPVSILEISDKADVIQAIALHKVILGSMAELSQFKEGLSVLGVSNALKAHPDLLYSYYCEKYEEKLFSDSIRKMFTRINYSDKGHNNRELEETAFMYFTDYLDECEKVINDCTPVIEETDEVCDTDPPQVNLKSILIFFTGADTIPPQGYPSANLYFSHSNIFPTASTCAITLTLPTKHIKYEHFKSHMNIAFSMHGGFGLM